MSAHAPCSALFPRKCPGVFVHDKVCYYLSVYGNEILLFLNDIRFTWGILKTLKEFIGVGHCIEVIQTQGVPRLPKNIIQQRLYRVFHDGREIEEIRRVKPQDERILVLSTTHVAICSLKAILSGDTLPCSFTAQLSFDFSKACNFSKHVFGVKSISDDEVEFKIFSSHPCTFTNRIKLLEDSIQLTTTDDRPERVELKPEHARYRCMMLGSAFFLVKEGSSAVVMYKDGDSSTIFSDLTLPRTWNTPVDMCSSTIEDKRLLLLTEKVLWCVCIGTYPEIEPVVIANVIHEICPQRMYKDAERSAEPARRHRQLFLLPSGRILAVVDVLLVKTARFARLIPVFFALSCALAKWIALWSATDRDVLRIYLIQNKSLKLLRTHKVSIGLISSVTLMKNLALVGGSFGGFTKICLDALESPRYGSDYVDEWTDVKCGTQTCAAGNLYILKREHDGTSSLCSGHDGTVLVDRVREILTVNKKMNEIMYRMENSKVQRSVMEDNRIVRTKTGPMRVDKAVWLNDETLLISEENEVETHFHISGDNCTVAHQVAAGASKFAPTACVLIPLNNGKSSLVVGCKNMLYYTQYSKKTGPHTTRTQMFPWSTYPGMKLAMLANQQIRHFPGSDNICGLTVRSDVEELWVLFAGGVVLKYRYHLECPRKDLTCFDLHLSHLSFHKTPIHDAHRFCHGATNRHVLIAGSNAPAEYIITDKTPVTVTAKKFDFLLFDFTDNVFLASIPMFGFYENIRRRYAYYLRAEDDLIVFNTSNSGVYSAKPCEKVIVHPLLTEVPHDIGVAALPDASSVLAAVGKHVTLLVYQPQYERWTRMNQYSWSTDYQCPRFTKVENNKCLLGVVCRHGIEILQIRLYSASGGYPACTVSPYTLVHYGNDQLLYSMSSSMGAWKTSFDFYPETVSDCNSAPVELIVTMMEDKPKSASPKVILCTVKLTANEDSKGNMGAVTEVRLNQQLPFKGKGMNEAKLQVVISADALRAKPNDDFVVLLTTPYRKALVEGVIKEDENKRHCAVVSEVDEKAPNSLQFLLCPPKRIAPVTEISVNADGNANWTDFVSDNHQRYEFNGITDQKLRDLVVGRSRVLYHDNTVTLMIRTKTNYTFVYAVEKKQYRIEYLHTTISHLASLHEAAPSVKTTVLANGSGLAYGDFLHVIAPCKDCLKKEEFKTAMKLHVPNLVTVSDQDSLTSGEEEFLESDDERYIALCKTYVVTDHRGEQTTGIQQMALMSGSGSRTFTVSLT